MSATTASPSLSRRSATTTALAPSRANRRAVAAPMPPAAPLTRATLPFMRMIRAPSSRKLEADDAGNDQANRYDAHGRCRIAKGQDADHEGADRADARPHGVGRAHGDMALRPQKQRAAGHHGDDGE